MSDSGRRRGRWGRPGRVARSLAAAGMALSALASWSSPAVGDTTLLSDVGWWTRRPGAQALPPGGFEVAAEPSGWLSVAAVRFDPGRIVGPVTLELTEASAVGPRPALQVCATTDVWMPANPGSAADAPEATCDAAVTMTEVSAGVWRAEVTGLADAGGSLVLRPVAASGADLVTRPAWQATFSGARLVDVTFAAPATSTSITTPATTGASTGGAGGMGSFGADAALGGFDPGGSFLTAVPSARLGVPAPIQLPEAGDGDRASVALPAPAGELFSPPLRSVGAGSSGGPNRPWGRLLVLVPLSAAFGAGLTWARRQAGTRGMLGAG